MPVTAAAWPARRGLPGRRARARRGPLDWQGWLGWLLLAVALAIGCGQATPLAASWSEPPTAREPAVVRNARGDAYLAVRFLRQGDDNTCAQAAMAMVLDYHGVAKGYQEVVNETNPSNLPTAPGVVQAYLRLHGLAASAQPDASLALLRAQIDQASPPIALLDFGGLDQAHFVVVVGYNAGNRTLLLHDSLDRAYVRMDEASFLARWEAAPLAQVLGRGYRRLAITTARVAQP